MSLYTIAMEQLAIGAALAGVEPAQGARLRGQDLHFVVAGRLYDAVSAAPVTAFGGDLDRAVTFHMNALDSDRAPLVTAASLAGYASLAQEATPAGLTAVYQQLLVNAAERDIDDRLGEIKNRSGIPADKRAAAIQESHTQLGYAVMHRDTLSTPDSRLLLDTTCVVAAEAAQPKGHPDHLHWYHHETVILAGIIQQPATLWSIATVIGRDAFTSPLHRDAFLALQQLAARQYQPIAPGLLHRHIQTDRDRGMGTRWVTEHSPAEEIAHLEALASKETVKPRETAAAARNLVTWHHTRQLNALNGTGATFAEPMPYPTAGTIPAPGIRL